MTDSTAAETNSLDVLAMVVAAAPAGPRDADLISLPGLAQCLALAVADQRDLPLPKAGEVVLDALLGAGEWAGKRPASLPVYRCYAIGPRRLDDECAELDGHRYKSERQRALEYPGWQLIAGYHLDEIPADTRSDAPAPRFLAVVREDALKAFGIAQQIARMRGAVEATSTAVAWSHVEGAAWTDKEKDAMFEMLHKQKMTLVAIAKKVGLKSRQRVSELVGTKQAWRSKDAYAGKPWKPSDELLARCGLKVSKPLQAVASASVGATREAA